MLRRDFALSLLATGAALPALAQRVAPKEGTEYVRLGKPVPVQAPAGQIEVVEFFAYSCIHCFNFEPLLEDWDKRKPGGTVLRRVPVAFSPAFVPMQRLYYTLEAMNLVERLHTQVFKAIHVDRLPLTTPGPITDWVAKQGVDRAKFSEIFNHGDTQKKAQDAAVLQDAYGVEGTPALGVAGRFYIPGQGPKTLTIANYLIGEARKA
ncbi:MAG TPA: thiol:disulfide interchange protein DsbA/DsbL [Hydrogenophaga sp.]|uniref:thiol:disulfide interchange protein DsbA/DsbL n=1 Tax=Hydrogenophaga sp. TaxID=1904254 RepID=UPI002D0D195A|nr:thiol:disulfide interchange protein DsbA/DsbL [Hydrogenophaga sp.]HSX92386.1 thiol:disulfide interchange protein DsbA/DsbL [Hydrogenophaga sp.]